MRVAHFVRFAPHQAGIYESAKELILAERLVGLDAQMIDYGDDATKGQVYSRVGCKDDDIVTVNPDWASKADILVRHSAIPKEIMEKGIPAIMCLHGAPEYSFMLEHTGATRTMKEIMLSVKNYKGLVTFWKQNLSQWEILLNRKVHYCPPTVNLEVFKPEGKKFNFGKDAGEINIVVTNIWRKEYHTPFNVLFAAAKFIKERCPKGRVHVFAVPKDNEKYPKNDGPVNRILLKLKEAKLVGGCYPMIKTLQDVYRAADMLVTPSTIAQRTVREALACGCPIVAAVGNSYTPYKADPRNIDEFVNAIDKCYEDIQADREAVRNNARCTAATEFNFEQAGKAMKTMFKEILNT